MRASLPVLAWFGVLLGASLGACSSISTSYDYDPNAAFTAWKTYRWLPRPKKGDAASPLVHERIVNAVDAGLSAKGYRKVKGEADFLIAAHVGSRRRVQVTNWGYGYGYWGGGRTDVYEYEEGTLILDFVDAASKKLQWRGTARAAVSDDPKPEEITKTVNEAVSKMLADFPPPKKK